MTVAVLIISHNQVGAELLNAATRMLGHCPLTATVLGVNETDDPDVLLRHALQIVEATDDGSGVLIITDLFGSTPANIASNLTSRPGVEVLTGANLPMLVRIFNYAQLDLAAMTEKAFNGGREGVLRYLQSSTS
ncbi:PTS fructose transporter subunit IIA [Rhodoferax sp. 4810]|uniref:PTS fructose transporter subunit IIA n=1 Tax=Thiospirillum jenense TaxID=1653858 RepID=A0A839HFT0_9GAMM|nr:PTS fructose transporter subunit IIA [Rhodoferax jenense]MBB1125222.1 PTS fructose transporter subunit IIA [Thiospirillum jenense]